MSLAAPSVRLTGRYLVEGAALFGTVDFTLSSGQWTCVLGRSGVGKTTLLRLLAGLDCAGRFEGEISTSDGAPIAGRASFMAQDDLLLPWLSVLENTVLGARLRGETPDHDQAEGLLQRVGLAAHLNKKPEALSGGMRQRNALARTLMEDRPLVFLDEPFSALDASTRAEMQELSAEVLSGKTVLLVTHDPAETVRLGHKALIVTAAGAEDWPLPANRPLRDPTAPDVVANQAGLLARLRALQ